jgi:hypothetical protein
MHTMICDGGTAVCFYFPSSCSGCCWWWYRALLAECGIWGQPGSSAMEREGTTQPISPRCLGADATYAAVHDVVRSVKLRVSGITSLLPHSGLKGGLDSIFVAVVRMS